MESEENVFKFLGRWLCLCWIEIFTSAEGGDVFTLVCLSVCLSDK